MIITDGCASRSARSTTALLLVFVATGCTALPDVSPFASATRQLAAAVTTGGAAIWEDFYARAATDAYLKADAGKFDAAWKVRNDTMTAAVVYADSLVAVVSGAAQTRDRVGALADKVKTLGEMAGILNPGIAAGAGVATDAAKFIGAQIALMLAAASLEDAVTRAQPAIERIASHMHDDATSLRSIVRALAAAEVRELNTQYGSATAYTNLLRAERDKLRGQSSFTSLKAQRAGLDDVEKFMALAAVEMKAYEEQRMAIDKRAKARLQLVAATGDALNRWSVAHAKVAEALRARQPVSVESLADAAVELRGLINRVREL
jgi:hypothetical protein